MWYVYLLECSDDSFYCGITTDLPRRVEVHNQGLGAKYTLKRRPVQLITSIGPMTQSEARKTECKIKRRKRHEKVPYMIELSNQLELVDG